MKKFAAICDTSKIFNYPPIISILAALGLNDNKFKTASLDQSLQLFSSRCEDYQDKEDVVKLLKKDNVTFECIYVGNLNTDKDIDTVNKFIDNFTSDKSSIVLNPVLEKDFTSHIDEMKKLISRSRVITPSYENAKALLGLNVENNPSFEELKVWMRDLSKMGPEVVMITDVPSSYHNNETFVAAYDRITQAYWIIPSCYKKDAPFNFVDVLTDLIVNESELSSVMNQYQSA